MEVMDRAAIADAISTELKADGQDVSASPEPEVAAPAEAAQEPVEATPAVEPAEVTQQRLSLTDKSMVIDPATGEEVEWGKIKAERMAHSEATKRFQAAADLRREAEQVRLNAEARLAQMELQMKQAQLPQLREEDDDYATHIRHHEERLNALAQYQLTMQQHMQEQLAERELAASRMALEAEEKRLATEHGLTQREIETVEREYYHRSNTGEQVTLDSIAKEHKAFLADLEEKAIAKWKEKHRVGAPAAAPVAPSVGAPEEPIEQGTRKFRDRIRDEFASMIGT